MSEKVIAKLRANCNNYLRIHRHAPPPSILKTRTMYVQIQVIRLLFLKNSISLKKFDTLFSNFVLIIFCDSMFWSFKSPYYTERNNYTYYRKCGMVSFGSESEYLICSGRQSDLADHSKATRAFCTRRKTHICPAAKRISRNGHPPLFLKETISHSSAQSVAYGSFSTTSPQTALFSFRLIKNSLTRKTPPFQRWMNRPPQTAAHTAPESE